MPDNNRRKALFYGTTAVDVLPDVARKIRIMDRFNPAASQGMMVGGKVANMAVAAAKDPRLDAHIYSAIGDDSAGIFAAKFLEEKNVNTHHLQTMPDHPTFCLMINPDTPGKVECISDNHASLYLDPTKMNVQSIADFRVAVSHASHNWDGLLHFQNRCKQAGLTSIFNPAPIKALKDVQPILDADVIIANAEEAGVITTMLGLPMPDAAFDLAPMLQSKTNKNFIVTHDDKGCVAAMGGQTFYAPVRPTKVIDSTGAGDTFLGFFVASQMQGDGVARSLQLATTAASLVCERLGAAASIPEYDLVLEKSSETPLPWLVTGRRWG